MPDSRETVLGLDIGTASAKALLVDDQGACVATGRAAIPGAHPRPGWSEQDPGDWWCAAKQAIATIARSHPDALGRCRAVGVSGQMHGAVLLDREAVPLRAAILWNDTRSTQQCDAAIDEFGLDRLVTRSGSRPFPGFTAPKVRWLREHEPATLERVAHLLLPKDYVVHRLTGAFASDVTDASGTSLLDIGARAWSDDLCALWGVEREWLPAVVESAAVVGPLLDGALPGLPAGVVVVAGAGDQAAAAVGIGAARPGVLSICIGTSGVVFAATEAYRTDPAGVLHGFCHARPATWHAMGVMLSAGGAIDWFCTATNASLAQVIEAASRAPRGSNGVAFVPHLAGERCPVPDPDGRASFAGLHLGTTFDDLARAVIESVAHGLAESARRMESIGVAFDTVRVTGGGTRNPLLLELLARDLGHPLEIAPVDEGSAYGAAALAGIGARWETSVDALVEKWLQRYR